MNIETKDKDKLLPIKEEPYSSRGHSKSQPNIYGAPSEQGKKRLKLDVKQLYNESYSHQSDALSQASNSAHTLSPLAKQRILKRPYENNAFDNKKSLMRAVSQPDIKANKSLLTAQNNKSDKKFLSLRKEVSGSNWGAQSHSVRSSSHKE